MWSVTVYWKWGWHSSADNFIAKGLINVKEELTEDEVLTAIKFKNPKGKLKLLKLDLICILANGKIRDADRMSELIEE